jgi:RNA polymerase sigma factor (TIGR02999 family)
MKGGQFGVDDCGSTPMRHREIGGIIGPGAASLPGLRPNMPHFSTPSVSSLLEGIRAGNRAAFDELLPLVYDELRLLAERQRCRWEGDQTLDTTALVHEAYLRLADVSAPEWQNRAHFLAVAATAMRQILIDYARLKCAAKRGGRRLHVPLHEVEAVLLRVESSSDSCDEILLALDDSLRRLDQWNRRQMRIVECRFFGSMSVEDTAEALGVSTATVKRGWGLARAWLYRDLKQSLEGAQ